jgi:hypothetical protein
MPKSITVPADLVRPFELPDLETPTLEDRLIALEKKVKRLEMRLTLERGRHNAQVGIIAEILAAAVQNKEPVDG